MPNHGSRSHHQSQYPFTERLNIRTRTEKKQRLVLVSAPENQAPSRVPLNEHISKNGILRLLIA